MRDKPYREKIREYLEAPENGYDHYGKWGILNKEQRQLITKLLNEMDGADAVIAEQQKEIEELNFKYQARKDRTIQEIENLKEKNKKEYDRGYKEGFKCKVSENWEKSKARTLTIKSGCISKDKIREKIKELENEIETRSLYEENWNKIEVLQELLEENKSNENNI